VLLAWQQQRRLEQQQQQQQHLAAVLVTALWLGLHPAVAQAALSLPPSHPRSHLFHWPAARASKRNWQHWQLRRRNGRPLKQQVLLLLLLVLQALAALQQLGQQVQQQQQQQQQQAVPLTACRPLLPSGEQSLKTAQAAQCLLLGRPQPLSCHSPAARA
jgi:hypothetical protein